MRLFLRPGDWQSNNAKSNDAQPQQANDAAIPSSELTKRTIDEEACANPLTLEASDQLRHIRHMDSPEFHPAIGATVWFTGLPCSGKTTVSRGVAARLRAVGARVEVLDGDVIRTNLSKGLGFSKEDRNTNVLRVGFVCELLSRNGVIAIAALVSPYRAIRNDVRAAHERFVEVFVNCPVEECQRRDVKGMYAKALRGEIANFTGVDDPYECPEQPELELRTDTESVDESIERVMFQLNSLGVLGTR